MSQFWSAMAKRAEPYVPGLQLEDEKIIKLNTNENPYPASPAVIAAIQQETTNLQLYPSATADSLREQIAEAYQLSKEEVYVGNGSDEVLAFSFMAFFDQEHAIRFPNITYSFYPVYANLFNISYEEIPLNEDFTMPIESMFQANGGVIFPNPNAPTGIYLELTAVEAVIVNNPNVVVIVDEAYIDFAGASAVELIRKYDNLLVIQTTSKSRSLAGLRVGLALGNPILIEGLMRIKDSINSYPLDRLALAGAQAAFADNAYFAKTTKQIITTREHVKAGLQALGFHVLPSQTNFVFATHPKYEASELYEQLFAKGILVRHFNKEPIDQYLRISIGTETEMERFLESVKEIIATAER